jgi:hypothetical protein
MMPAMSNAAAVQRIRTIAASPLSEIMFSSKLSNGIVELNDDPKTSRSARSWGQLSVSP